MAVACRRGRPDRSGNGPGRRSVDRALGPSGSARCELGPPRRDRPDRRYLAGSRDPRDRACAGARGVIGQRALIAIALVCGAIAGTIYYASLQRVTVVVAAHALDADKPIALDDVVTRELPPEAVPAGAVRSAEDAIGRVPRGPHWPGQILIGSALGTGAAAFHSG